MKNKLLAAVIYSFIFSSAFTQSYPSIPKNDVSTSTNIDILARKGNKVYLSADDEISIEGLVFLNEDLTEYNYWVIVESPQEADFIIELNCIKKFRVTTYAVYTSSKFINADGKTILETKEYKSTPTAFNEFNALKGSIQEMIHKEYKKKFIN